MKQWLMVFLSVWLLQSHAQPPQIERNTFFQTHGLVFFFASTCPYCHQFAPVVSQVSKRLGMRVLPLSFDNQPLPEFQEIMPATSEWVTVAFKNEPIHYPALFIANPRLRQLYPVSIGALSEIELTTRLADLALKITTYENQGRIS